MANKAMISMNGGNPKEIKGIGLNSTKDTSDEYLNRDGMKEEEEEGREMKKNTAMVTDDMKQLGNGTSMNRAKAKLAMI